MNAAARIVWVCFMCQRGKNEEGMREQEDSKRKAAQLQCNEVSVKFKIFKPQYEASVR